MALVAQAPKPQIVSENSPQSSTYGEELEPGYGRRVFLKGLAQMIWEAIMLCGCVQRPLEVILEGLA